MDFELKHFTLDEAQSLLPVLESLLKRAVEAKRGAEEIEERMQALNRKIFLTGGLFVDVERVRTRRCTRQRYELHPCAAGKRCACQ